MATLTAAQASCYGPIGTAAAFGISSDPNQNVLSCCPLKTGMSVCFTADTANANLSAAALEGGGMTIVNIQITAAGAVQVNLSGAIDTAGGGGALAANPILHVTSRATGLALSGVAANYVWNNPRLIVPKVVPPAQFAEAMMMAIMKNQYSVDVCSYVNYRSAIVGTTTASTSIIPADLSRVKSILTVPIEESNKNRGDRRNALCPALMEGQSYQYQINNKMQPSRLVSLARENFGIPSQWFVNNWEVTKAVPYQYGLGNCLGAVHGYELEKALEAANIPVHNISFITKNETQNGCWALGRTLGSYGATSNLMGISAIVYINYSGGNANLKLLHNFVSHIRSYAVGPGGVTVLY